MDIVSALFTETFNLRTVEGPATRIDLSGVFFSMASPTPVPVTIEPHLMVLIRCRPDEPGNGILEVTFVDPSSGQDVEVAKNMSPFTVEPGKFTYRLVRAQLAFDSYTTIEARCKIGTGHETIVPLTLLPPVG